MRSVDEAESEAQLIGLQYGDFGWKIAVDASMRGWPAWRIAQHLQCKPELIERLGGPAVTNGDRDHG